MLLLLIFIGGGTLVAAVLFVVGCGIAFGAVNLTKRKELGANTGNMKIPVSVYARVGVYVAILIATAGPFLVISVAILMITFRVQFDASSFVISPVILLLTSLPSLIVFAVIIEKSLQKSA